MSQYISKESYKRMEAPLFNVSLHACKDFIKSLADNNINPTSLDIFKTSTIREEIDHLSYNIAEDIHADISSALQDDSCGIAALDIPEGVSNDPTHDALVGAIVAQAIVNKFMSPAIDRKNHTPFTLYNASKEGEKKLKKSGLRFYSPEEKLGFHTDGRIDSPNVYIPERLSIYNLLIAYKKPGDFYWLPFALWGEFESFAESIGWNVPYKFELTPIVYSGRGGELERPTLSAVEAPIFFKEGPKKSMFYNGELADLDNGIDNRSISMSLRESMQNNIFRYYVPQRARRVIIMNNSSGAHSRDIFNSPVAGTRYTRSFMRSISLEGMCVGRTYHP
ncbi:hypothetical protein SAMN05192555_1089 [Franzmannia pantelleriensis]|uniref:Taurine catabolism dioxygenase TauD, TfdA family n=1 Tax=Franzmannia pantelleriensis TaxID=48727 RepID=A0A1G9P696_9GAMM|nr:hypothetical protein [Halomonas pantelleriensis]SDL94412.1 hypothetical protein SAMN05192555_1089 [Halomonas pantelleriensis]